MFWTFFQRAKMVVAVGVLSACSSTISNEVSIKQYGSGKSLIVLLGGSEGGHLGNSTLRSKLISNGFSVAEIAYFGFAGGPKNLSEINVNAVSGAVTKLQKDRSCVGILGVSKGAELALVLASHKNISSATVAVTPSNVVWQSSKASLAKDSSWLLDGKPMSFVPYQVFSRNGIAAALDYNKALPLHLEALKNKPAAQKASIKVERINQPVLLQAAEQDQIWPSLKMSQAIMDRADQFNSDHDFALKSYEHDHYLLKHADVLEDAVKFFKRNISKCN